MSKGTYSFTTPHLLRQRGPAPRHGVHHHRRRHGGALPAHERYDVAFVTGMDEHGQKVADTAAAKGMTPQDWCDSWSPRSARRGTCWASPILTSCAPPSRATRKACRSSGRTSTTRAGATKAATRAGTACTRRRTTPRATSRRTRRGSSCAPTASAPCRRRAARRMVLQLSEFGDKLLAFYEENPDFIRPETRKNEIVSFVKSGLKDLSISRSHVRLGRAAAVRRGACGLRVGRRAAGLPHRHRLR